MTSEEHHEIKCGIYREVVVTREAWSC